MPPVPRQRDDSSKVLDESHIHTKLPYCPVFDDPASDAEPEDDDDKPLMAISERKAAEMIGKFIM